MMLPSFVEIWDRESFLKDILVISCSGPGVPSTRNTHIKSLDGISLVPSFTYSLRWPVLVCGVTTCLVLGPVNVAMSTQATAVVHSQALENLGSC